MHAKKKNQTTENDIGNLSEKHYQKLIKENDMFRKALDNLSFSAYITDKNGNALFINKTSEGFVRVRREILIGKNVEMIEQKGIFYPSAAKLAIKEGKKITILQTMSDGATYLVTAIPTFDDDANLEFVIAGGRYLRGGSRQGDAQILDYLQNTKHINQKYKEPDIIYGSSKTEQVLKLLQKISMMETTVLFLGETGVGKSLYAKYLHWHSTRSNKNMIEISCGAIPEALLESELFGYVGGAFTSAQPTGKRGLIEIANGGILFLDEIGELPSALQVKLLTMLQERKIRRIGGTEDIPVDIQVVAATNADLKQLVEKGRFREDLYYRLNVVPIIIEPLRKRVEDIIPLAEYFLKHYNEKYNCCVKIEERALEMLKSFSWPGNVRELENFIERMIIMNYSGIIREEDVQCIFNNGILNNSQNIVVNNIVPFQEAMEEMEEQLITKAYNIYPSSYKLAKALNISQSSAYNKIIKYIKDEKA